MTYEDSDCSILHQPEITPRECCEYPIIYINETTIKKCFQRCPPIKSDRKYENETEKEKDQCCLIQCFYEKEKLLAENGTTDLDTMKESFKTRNGSDLSPKWTEAVERAVTKCGDYCEYKSTFRTGSNLTNEVLN